MKKKKYLVHVHMLKMNAITKMKKIGKTQEIKKNPIPNF
jgi:hypothetical protein